MTYHIATTTTLDFEHAIAETNAALARHGFGVLSDIDVSATLAKKLGTSMPPYRILGACNPALAQQALAAEPLIGTMLPCNVVVREDQDGGVQVAAVDPVASMQAVDNSALGGIAAKVRDLLETVVGEIGAAKPGPWKPGP